jgi:hypothetical protein
MIGYRSLSVALLFAIAAAAPARAEVKRFGLTAFDQVEVRGDMVVEIVPDWRLSAVAEGSSDAIDSLSFDVVDRTLTIQQMMEGPYGMRRSQDGALHIRLAAQNLSGVVVRGSGRVTVSGLRGDAVLLVLDGAGRIDAAVASGGTVRSRVAGSGVLAITGRADRLESIVTGPGSVDASALGVRDVMVRANGTGTSRYAATHSATVNASGNASVDVAGRGQCTVSNTGTGQVTCAGARSALSRPQQ